MKNYALVAIVFALLCPAAALAQEPSGNPTALWEIRDSFSSWQHPGEPGLEAMERSLLPRDLAEPDPTLPTSFPSTAFTLVQEEIAPHLRFSLTFSARLDVPGDTAVDSIDNIAYSDVFDVGYGLSVEANLLSWLTPHWAMGGYLSIGWDRFVGASDVDMGTGEFFTFGNQDTVNVIVGAKVLQKFAPFWFWEGRMGVGFVHYGELSFSDVTTPVTVSGLQFFRPINRGLFDLAGRLGVGNSRVTFDFGMDFRFMGGAARGRDVSNVVDPDVFFVFALDVGLSLRF